MAEEINKTEEQKPAKAEKKKEKKPGFFAKAKKFLKELKSEISETGIEQYARRYSRSYTVRYIYRSC